MNDTVWAIIAAALLILLMIGNRKVRLISLFSKQIRVFKNARTNKVSVWDIFCFIVFPTCLALIVVYGLKICIDNTLSEILTTVFSLVFTVLFGFAAIIVGKLDSKNELEKKVVEETFISIMSATILSLISVICSIVVVKIEAKWAISLVSAIVYSVSIMTIMLLLLVSKRTFIIYNDTMEK